MSTDFQSFLHASKSYTTVPVFERFFLDMITPIQIFQKLKENACFLLESKDSESPWSRYSFIGIDPFLILKEEENRFVARKKNGEVFTEHDSFREALNNTMKMLNPKPVGIQLPFSGGGVGYISHDGITEFEKNIDPHPENDLNITRFHFAFCEMILAYDHDQKELIVVSNVFVEEKDDETKRKLKYDLAKEKIKLTMDCLLESEAAPFPLFQMPEETSEVSFEHVRTNFEKQDFLNAVEKVKAYIAKGEISQAVISQRFDLDLTVSGLDIYRVLRVINPSPYLFYMKIDDFEIVGSSPEKLVQINGKHIEIHPIAGTRHRGKTEEEDKQLAQELLNDKKERAEHIMLVDTAKEDIGRVAEEGSVQVPDLMYIGRFSHVMHIISKVTGKLADDAQPVDALISAFPAGTLSGSPKKRAVEIIHEIEPLARNLYGGAIGYIGFDGNIDSCITIRSVFIKDQKAYVQAGAGIVADSVPEREWEETRNKAKALIKAIEIAENLFHKKEAAANHV
ncbi:anthranilate synthase component I [Pueribacillus theae]|uniref:Anthranilate synthase component 1 n=1 Tax=Pueribacillus theae TaxID=2171751 RepID=A0A2U1K5C7_9BACI|nr:anthranilate synthase component I [Pueribacillus theae]PWA12369.1 anthranilate synthase component I [Pueribacillus theae]